MFDITLGDLLKNYICCEASFEFIIYFSEDNIQDKFLCEELDEDMKARKVLDFQCDMINKEVYIECE